MKKIKYLLFLLLFIPTLVLAKDDVINKIDVNIVLDSNGAAHITEVWNVKANMGTEFYKAAYNLGNMKISNFKVMENSQTFTFTDNWNINASISDKAYKNGFYHSNSGLELCWGKGSLGNHTFTISYDVSNFVFKTDDAQVLYWNIINEMEQMPGTFRATITGPHNFKDTLDVWGYGYKGYAYVNSGKIMMSNEENTKLSNGDYVVLLVKFPVGTFNVATSNTYSYYGTFNDVFKKAEEGTYDYDYDNNSIINDIFSIISSLFIPTIVAVVLLIIFKNGKYKFGPAGSKINMKEINNFRDIPCDKNIFQAYFLAQAYKLNKKNTDFLGSIFLKWLFEDKIEIQKVNKKNLFGTKEEQTIVLKNVVLDNDVEQEMYDILISASNDNILESKELEKWGKNNYNKLFKWFDKAESYGRDLYIDKSLVCKEKSKYVIKDELKIKAIELAGLKKFLLEFSRIQEREAIEVKLWKEYLMFAQIFGIADKVSEQFKNLYPEVLSSQEYGNVDFADIMILNSLSHAMANSAYSARSAAQSYSSGGGGFSSGGGGGGSFGGGGGGGR